MMFALQKTRYMLDEICQKCEYENFSFFIWCNTNYFFPKKCPGIYLYRPGHVLGWKYLCTK